MHRVNKLKALLGVRVREYRELRGLSQEDLGKAAGTTRMSVYRIEEGKIPTNIDMIDRIASALDTSAAELLAEDDSTAPRPSIPHDILAALARADADALRSVRAVLIGHGLISRAPDPAKR